MLHALQFMHERGLVHKDVKVVPNPSASRQQAPLMLVGFLLQPGNFCIDESSGKHQVYILDMGKLIKNASSCG
jgi:serine/threonine protein kinase